VRAQPRASILADSRAFSRAVPWLAGALPLAYYIATARAHGGLFEEGSFVAAARGLGVAHAPGAPIESLLAAGLALVPVGPLPFRVAIVSALCAALTLSLFASALMSTLRHLRVAEERFSALLALGASWWLAQTPLFFEQAVRPQVFAVQFALALLIIYTLLRFEEEEPHGSTRVLYFGAFLQGLCFANHHVYGLLLLPVAAPTLGRVFARRGFVGLMGYVTAPIVGFSVYLYVPLRLAHLPESGLAKDNGFTRMLTVLGEEPYAGPSWAEPVSLTSVVHDGLALSSRAGLALALLFLITGLWVALRASHPRRFGTLWFIALIVPLLSAQWVLSPRVPEDAWGALLPSACAATAIASAGCAFLCTRLLRLPGRALDALGAAAIALALYGLVAHDSREARAENRVADEADELLRRQLAPNAVLFGEEASSAFWFQGREAEEALRADITYVPLFMRTRAHVVEAWAEQAPELSDALRALVLSGALDAGSLQSLNALRPVYVEPSASLPRALLATTLSEGLLLRLRSEGVTKRDLREAEIQRALRVAPLLRLNAALPEARLARQKLARAQASTEPEP
jgi:Protein of unknown function (DUF2723)